MSSSDYELHLKRNQFDALFDDGAEGDFPFGEDREALDRLISEELGSPRRRRRKKKLRP